MRTHNPRRYLSLLACCLGPLLLHCADARPLQQVLNDGTLRVGVALAAPWALKQPDGTLGGFEVDVAKQLAEDMGVKAQIEVYSYDRLIRALESSEIDVIAAGLSITPARALHVNFSQPYAEGGIGLATDTTATAGVRELAELNSPDYTFAAVEKTVAEELARRLLPQAKLATYASADAATRALLAGEVQGYIENEPVPTFLALENPGQIDAPLAQPLLRAPTAFAVNKGDPDFVAFLNAWITSREADTWLATMRNYWFKTLSWQEQFDHAPAPR